MDTYDPTTDWLNGLCPAHPGFDNHCRIQDILTTIKLLLLDKIFEGCTNLVKELEYQCMENITYEDWEEGNRLNLWNVVAEKEKSLMATKKGELANGEDKGEPHDVEKPRKGCLSRKAA